MKGLMRLGPCVLVVAVRILVLRQLVLEDVQLPVRNSAVNLLALLVFDRSCGVPVAGVGGGLGVADSLNVLLEGPLNRSETGGVGSFLDASE